MSSTTHTLLHPVEITIPMPAKGSDEQPGTRTKRVTEIPLRPVSGRAYLDIGDVVIQAESPGGGSYEIELDDKLREYLVRRVDDPANPEAALARKALRLPDAMALRADTIEAINLASNAAWAARQKAPAEGVKLLQPVEAFGEKVEVVPLKCPTGDMFDRFGQPYVKSRLGDGSLQFVEKTEIIAKYIARAIDHEQPELILAQVSLADMIQIKMAVTGFFTQAVAEVNGWRRSMLSSSEPNTSPSPTPSA